MSHWRGVKIKWVNTERVKRKVRHTRCSQRTQKDQKAIRETTQFVKCLRTCIRIPYTPVLAEYEAHSCVTTELGVKRSGQTDWGRRTLFTAHLAEQFRFMFTWDSQKIGIKWCSLRSTQACVSVHVNVCEHRGRHMWILGIAVNKPKVNKLSCYLKFVLSKPLRKIFVNPFFVSWDWNLEPCMLPLTCNPNPRKTWVTFYEK